MSDLVTIYQQETGRAKKVPRRQYDNLWKGRNWRLTPPKPSPSYGGDVMGDTPDNEQGDES